jgi:hypothetical protein
LLFYSGGPQILRVVFFVGGEFTSDANRKGMNRALSGIQQQKDG